MPRSETSHYLGNPLLKAAGVEQQFAQEEIKEYIKCSQDPIYFIKNYIQIVSLDKGLVPFDLWDFQEEVIQTVHNNRFVICKFPRQTGKSTTMIAYILHYVLFNDNMNVAVLANKLATARELLSRLQLAYEHLPKWLQQGVISWNKGSIELENGSRIIASATSSSAVRGGSFNMIFLDEFAYVPHEVADEFFSSVYPTISSGTDTKILMVSTPRGMNLFYKYWRGANKKEGEPGKNTYVPIEVHWSQVPGRDEKWKRETIANSSEEQFRTEFECEFLGSVNTLISPAKLKCMTFESPILKREEGLKVYKKPEKDRQYFITVDTSRGLGQDYHAFIVVDTTESPYEVVATFRNNEMPPMIYPNVIYQTAKEYNEAQVLCELNDIGGQVADILRNDLEYENMLSTSMRGRAGQILGEGFGQQVTYGMKMTQPVKKIGCSTLKSFIETDKLITNDYNILEELINFVSSRTSYEADAGHNDDLVMCLVIFAWMTTQKYFQEYFDIDLRKQLYETEMKNIEEDIMPFGFIQNGIDEQYEVDNEGNIWF
jgi:hypothetical protein